jgi:hypothetical protein
MTLRSRAVRALHPAGGYRIGANTWYLVAGDGVLEVRDGIVSEIGIVNHSLTRGSSRARYFFGSFG